jgi:uncharacterized surface protein with fasciclin (FAS1) repeats
MVGAHTRRSYSSKESVMRKLFVTTIAVVALGATLAACGGSSSSTSAQAPASTSTASSEPNLVQTAVDAGQFTTLVSLVKQAGLANTLSGPGPYTVLAPTDAAFAKVPKATLTALSKDPAKLKAVLLNHVVKGDVTADKVITLKSATTLQGSSLPVRVSGKTVYIGGAKVTKADVTASNGVIHAIDQVLVPSGA